MALRACDGGSGPRGVSARRAHCPAHTQQRGTRLGDQLGGVRLRVAQFHLPVCEGGDRLYGCGLSVCVFPSGVYHGRAPGGGAGAEPHGGAEPPADGAGGGESARREPHLPLQLCEGQLRHAAAGAGGACCGDADSARRGGAGGGDHMANGDDIVSRTLSVVSVWHRPGAGRGDRPRHHREGAHVCAGEARA